MTEAPVSESPSPNVNLAPAFNAVQQQLSSNLSLQAENLSLPAEAPSLSAVELTYLADASLQLSSQLETRIRILDEQGRVLIDSAQKDPSAPDADLGTDPLIVRALNGTYASRTEQGGKEATMHLALPATAQERLVGVVYLSQPLRDVTAVLHDLQTRLMLSVGIGLLLSALVGWFLSRAVSEPLRHLTQAAGAIAQGEFDQQVPVKSRDEIGHLSRAFNDMTARLQAARQMQMDLVANVSHELRTPLTAVKGTVETLREGAVDDPQVRDRFLETIERETDRLIRLVNDLLLLSRADSEALNLRREPVNLVDLARDVVDRLTARAEVREVVLQVDSVAIVPLAWADRDRIAQVMFNLIDNAIKYSRPRGSVTVQVDNGQGVVPSVLVRVRDEGIGIPAEDLSRIGQRFYRADRARSRAEGGSGLGVAIARALVQAHGGQLWLESREGAGTVVSFTLPAV
jgi:signal transduction histidine kinase